MPNESDLQSDVRYLLGVALLSPVEGATAILLGWSIVYGLSQGLREIQAGIDSNPAIWGLMLMFSATAGWLVGLGCRNHEARWLLACLLLTALHVMLFAFNFLIAAALQSV